MEEKREILELHLKKAMQIWMSGKRIMVFTGPELTALLKWYNVPKPGEGKVEEKKKRLKEIVNGGMPARLCAMGGEG